MPPGGAEACVRRMMAALGHRGPDDEGFFASGAVTLGMRRLSIIDLAAGRQPLYNEDGRIAVILNGEIYNFRELRRELESLGHIFRTQSDTEAVAHAYEQWGDECLLRLRGMFAVAVAESPVPGAPPSRLLLARDPLGIKPLYYAVRDGVLTFASEVRALLAAGGIEPRLSPDAVESYLLFGSVGEPMTLVEGVYSLPPGHRLVLKTSRVSAAEPKTYWSPPPPAVSQVNDAAGRLRSLLEESVRLHLIADVPTGVFLSSGVDSTALAGLASRTQPGIHTFTVTFPEQEFSEAEIARRSAERFGASHRELLLPGEEMLARLDRAVAALDQPSMDGINTYFVSWAARQAGLKVALSGLGADELFGGYPTFQTTPRLERAAAAGRRMPGVLRRAATAAMAATQRRADASRKLAAAWDAPESLPHPYFFARALFTPDRVAQMMAGQCEETAPWLDWLRSAADDAERFDSFTAVSWLEARSYMVNTLLRDTDAMSMAHSLEVRVPFLDVPLVEFVLGLPAAAKQRNGAPKSLLRDALSDVLPTEVAAQRKRTFTFPWERWLRGPLAARVEAGLTESAAPLQDVLQRGAARQVWREFQDGRTSWSRPWALYVLNEWARRHLSAAAAEPAGKLAS